MLSDEYWLYSTRFQDTSPAAVQATLLDEGQYLCSTRTMYRILDAAGGTRERRDQCALEIASGRFTRRPPNIRSAKISAGFLRARFLLPADKEVHVILDNYCTHKRNEDWLTKFEGRVQFHFTPTSASWLNQIEIWFGLLTLKSLRWGSFAGKYQLRDAIQAFVTLTNEHPKPRRERKREVKGSKFRNTIVNLLN